MRHLPNALTAFRLVSAPVLAALLCAGGAWQEWAAFALFAAAAMTDHLDGFLARRWQAESAWGRQLDPMADKLLTAAGLIGLAMAGTLGGIHLAAAGIILVREVLISAAREMLAQKGAQLPVTGLARVKTAAQGAAIGLLLATPLAQSHSGLVLAAGLALLWTAAGLTVWTGIAYLRRAWSLWRPPLEHVP